MDEQYREFQRRVGRIDRLSARRGRTEFVMRADGLLVPRTRSRLRFHFPWRAVMAGFVATVVVKGFLIFYLGEEGYVARMEALLTGSEYEQVAATILMPDPVSIWVGERIADAVRASGLT